VRLVSIAAERPSHNSKDAWRRRWKTEEETRKEFSCLTDGRTDDEVDVSEATVK
jgi:hypothetical protein